jgi:hypothetical protein
LRTGRAGCISRSAGVERFLNDGGGVRDELIDRTGRSRGSASAAVSVICHRERLLHRIQEVGVILNFVTGYGGRAARAFIADRLPVFVAIVDGLLEDLLHAATFVVIFGGVLAELIEIPEACAGAGIGLVVGRRDSKEITAFLDDAPAGIRKADRACSRLARENGGDKSPEGEDYIPNGLNPFRIAAIFSRFGNFDESGPLYATCA